MSDYTLQPKAVRKIMTDEIRGKFAILILTSPLLKDFLFAIQYDVLKELDEHQYNYAQLDVFCGKYYQMSLEDWVKSL